MRWKLSIFCSAVILGAALVLGGTPSHAYSEQDRAREAAKRGEIMPLATIQRNVRQRVDGKIIGTQFRSGGQSYVYEFRVLAPNGSVVNVDVDARTSRIIEVQGSR